jgi:hypothetical protein
LLAAEDLYEAGLPEGREEAGVGRGVGFAAARGIERITFDDSGALGGGVGHGGVQELEHEALAPVRAADVEAGNGPHRLIVHALEDAYALFSEAHVGIAWGDGTPARGPAVYIAQDAGHFARVYDFPEGATIPHTSLRRPIFARHSPPHAPATGIGAVGTEELLEVGPALGREGVSLEGGLGRPSRRFGHSRPSCREA